jgi:hypothetical protein
VQIDRCTNIVTGVQARLDSIGLTGHFEFWGPRGYHLNSPDHFWANKQWTPLYQGPGQTVRAIWSAGGSGRGHGAEQLDPDRW